MKGVNESEEVGIEVGMRPRRKFSGGERERNVAGTSLLPQFLGEVDDHAGVAHGARALVDRAPGGAVDREGRDLAEGPHPVGV